jgi:hypothetical protein
MLVTIQYLVVAYVSVIGMSKYFIYVSFIKIEEQVRDAVRDAVRYAFTGLTKFRESNLVPRHDD